MLSGFRIAEGRTLVAVCSTETGALAAFATTFTGADTTLLSLPSRDTLDDFRSAKPSTGSPRELVDYEC